MKNIILILLLYGCQSTFLYAFSVQKTTGSALIGGTYNLIDNTGQAVNEKSYLGKYSLIFFGFTHCPNVCPLGLHKMASALKGIENFEKNITAIFISVDPERDTPKRMTTYLNRFHHSFVGLTGSDAQLEHVAKVFRAYFFKSQDPDSKNYSYDHSSIIYLMDTQGKYVTHFSDVTSISDMRSIIKENIKIEPSLLLDNK